MIVNKKGKSFKRFKGNSCSDFGGSGSDGYNGGYDGGMVGGSGQQAPKVDFTTSLKAKSNKKSKTIWSNAKKVIRAPLAIPGAVIGSTAALGVGALRGVAKVGEIAGRGLNQQIQGRRLRATRHDENEALGLREKKGFRGFFGYRSKTKQFKDYQNAAKLQQNIVDARNKQLKQIYESDNTPDVKAASERELMEKQDFSVKDRRRSIYHPGTWLRDKKDRKLLNPGTWFRNKIDVSITNSAGDLQKKQMDLAASIATKTGFASPNNIANKLNIAVGQKAKKGVRAGLQNLITKKRTEFSDLIKTNEEEIKYLQNIPLDNRTLENGTRLYQLKDVQRQNIETYKKFNNAVQKNKKTQAAKNEYIRRKKMTLKTVNELSNLGSTIKSGIKKSFSSSLNATGASNPISSVFKAVFKAPALSLFYSLKKTLPKGILEIKQLVFDPSTTDILKKNNNLTEEINSINTDINLKMTKDGGFNQKYSELELIINDADHYKQADLIQSFNTYNDLTAKQKELFDKQKEIGELKSKKTLESNEKQDLLKAENELIQLENALYNANSTFKETLRNLPDDENKGKLEALYESGNTIIKLTLQNQQKYSDINQTYKELRRKNQRDIQIVAKLPTTDTGVAKLLADSGYLKKDKQAFLRLLPFINGNKQTISDNEAVSLNKEILALKKNMLEDPSTTSREKKVRLLKILEARAKVYMYDKIKHIHPDLGR